ncbi:MAG: Mut7-C RNAse domain-containing protein [Promethearchaeota archaeon]
MKVVSSKPLNFKFICDAMLGRLARSLRFFGYDTLYVGEMERNQHLSGSSGNGGRAMSDNEILNWAVKSDRLILTKDEMFSRMDPSRVILLKGKDLRDYFLTLKETLGLQLKFDQSISRCFRCNEIVKPVSKSEIKGKVKEKTFINYNEFFQCPTCKQVFWKGSHFSREKDGIFARFDGILDN